MSTHEFAVASPPPPSPCHVQEIISILDTEMTYPLTPTDGRSRSSSPIKDSEMSAFNSARERNERMTSRRGSQSGSWVREGTPGYYQSNEYNPNAPMMSGPFGNGRPRGNSNMVGENSVPLSTVVPGTVWPSEAQLSTAYAYGIRRDDGRITRLIPADERFTGQANPNMPTYQGPEGLILLPPTRVPSPSRRYGPEEMVPMDIVVALATGRPDTTQLVIDNIVNSHSKHVSQPFQRREKIYCDKWIHEGVCAFTQMGCKYKHEMPTDKATQLSLGLNHGLPNWYRRAYGVNLHNSPTSHPVGEGLVSPSPINRQLDGNWRRGIENGPSRDGVNGGDRRAPGGRTSFGPIGPPPSFGGTNPYSKLKVEDDEHEEGEDDDDTVTWRGRSGQQQH